MNLQWEKIESSSESEFAITKTFRLKVCGGWIIERWGSDKLLYHYFLPDPAHSWGEEAVQGGSQCSDCGEISFVEDGLGGRCLVCKVRYCAGCKHKLITEDLNEKCTECGHFNEI